MSTPRPGRFLSALRRPFPFTRRTAVLALAALLLAGVFAWRHYRDRGREEAPAEDALTAEAEAILRLCDQSRFPEARERLLQIQKELTTRPPEGDHRARLLLAHAEGLLFLETEYFLAAYHHYSALVPRCRSVLGAEDPLTLKCRNSLAVALYALGEDGEAEAEDRAVLAIMERVLGPEHPETLASRNKFAGALQLQGRNVEAEAENRGVLALRERVRGPQHPDTLGSRFNLALCLLAQKKNQEARQEAEAAYAGRKKVLGEGHPKTVAAKRFLEHIPSDK